MLRRIMLSLALACAPLFALAGNNDLSVRLAMTDRNITNDQEVLVDLTFTNNGDTPISMLGWFVPDSDMLEGHVFQVSRNGTPVAYLGAHIKRAAPTRQDMITLAPGESLTRTVDLSSVFDLSVSGVYSVQYVVSSTLLFAFDRNAMLADSRSPDRESVEIGAELTSNTVASWVDGRKSPLIEQAIAARAGQSFATAAAISFSGRCSATQQSTLTSAHSAAKTMANGAVTYLNGTPGATPRYTTWFGTYSSAGWSEVKTNFGKIKGALDSQPIVYDCSCKKSYYAYVYPTQPYKVYLCRAFWNAPLTGTDSKGGTIVHELSHFNIVAGTDDIAYGQSAAKSLAISNPAQARQNADSHEYFAENTPALN